ncbi:unnamed protein product, partial [Closterium sp. Naga37s-1]
MSKAVSVERSRSHSSSSSAKHGDQHARVPEVAFPVSPRRGAGRSPYRGNVRTRDNCFSPEIIPPLKSFCQHVSTWAHYAEPWAHDRDAPPGGATHRGRAADHPLGRVSRALVEERDAALKIETREKLDQWAVLVDKEWAVMGKDWAVDWWVESGKVWVTAMRVVELESMGMRKGGEAEVMVSSMLMEEGMGDRGVEGVHYIVSEVVFKKLPEEEKRLWHSHYCEIFEDLWVNPGVLETMQQQELKKLVNTYGKFWSVWQFDRGNALPLCPPALMLSPQDHFLGRVPRALVEERDASLGIETGEKRKRR